MSKRVESIDIHHSYLVHYIHSATPTWDMGHWLIADCCTVRRSESTNHGPPGLPDALRLTVVLRRSGRTSNVSP